MFFKYLLSTKKVAKGRSEAVNTINNSLKFHFWEFFSKTANKTYPIKSIPCVIPMGYKKDL